MENFSALWHWYLNAVEHCGQGRAHRAAAHTVEDPYGVKDHSRIVMEKRHKCQIQELGVVAHHFPHLRLRPDRLRQWAIMRDGSWSVGAKV